MGKTAGVLFPVLKDALSRGQRVIYVTPKNSQHAVAEDAAARFEDAGSKIRALTITAKGKICLKEEPLCDPAFCEYADGYHTKMRENAILDSIGGKRKLVSGCSGSWRSSIRYARSNCRSRPLPRQTSSSAITITSLLPGRPWAG